MAPQPPMQDPTRDTQQQSCDVLVVGSGAGGMAAALTAKLGGLDVLVVEKEPQMGGTTARSGGWLWVPCNPLSVRSGVDDSLAAARMYLQHEAGNYFDPERVDALLANAPEMIAFFEQNTEVRFIAAPAFPDYHPDAPGGTAGRCICAEPFDGRRLAKAIDMLPRPMRAMTFLGMAVSSGAELTHFSRATRSLRSAMFVAGRLAKHVADIVRHGRGMRLTNGNALAGRLLRSAIDRDVPIWLNAPARALLMEDGAVRGAVIERDGGRVEVRARKGVVLATGGFPHDPQRRDALFPFPPGSEHWPLAPEGNTGDGLRLAEAVGGVVDNDLAEPAAWVPVSRVRWRDGQEGCYVHIIDRAKPGIIAVTRTGRRFVNEACSYHDFVQGMVHACRGSAQPEAFLLCDHRALRRYGLGFVKPFPVPIGPHLRSGYLTTGDTVAELADRIGVDAATLEETLATYNAAAREGRDPAFGKGSTAYNRYMGDSDATPNPCVGPIVTPPFYAVRVVPGHLSTYAGLRTDGRARVLDAHRRPILGLYAVGSDMMTPAGGSYPAGGANLAPAMTFGFIAARDLIAGASP